MNRVSLSFLVGGLLAWAMAWRAERHRERLLVLAQRRVEKAQEASGEVYTGWNNGDSQYAAPHMIARQRGDS
jgi:hypothetical protein